MKQSSRKSARGFVRHSVVADGVRRAIFEGRFRPGDKLPPHVDLQRQFDTTPVTVQRALHELRDEGFIRTGASALGTCVAEHPPCWYRYALVLDDQPPKNDRQWWSRFHVALCDSAREINKVGPRQIEVYYDINGRLDSPEYHRLVDDISSRRVAGLMFANYPHDLMQTPLIKDRGMPRVVGSVNTERAIPEVATPFWRPLITSLKWIAEQGRRSVAVITIPQIPQRGLMRRIDRSGLKCDPFWVQAVSPNFAEWVRHAVSAILRAKPSALPEALLVTDDHLVEGVADALLEFGIRVPDDMLVVGHWNFPLEFQRDLPIQLIGRDNTNILYHWISSIDAQRRGNMAAARRLIKPTIAGVDRLREPIDVQQLPAPTV